MRRVAMAGLCALALACHHGGGGVGSDGGSGTDGGGSPAGGFNTMIRTSYCTVLANCGLFSNAAVCDSLTLQFEPELDPNVVAAIDAGKVTFDSNAAAACSAAIASATCDATMSEPGRVLPDPCYGIIAGTVAPGGTCGIDEECVSQVCSLTPGCTGTCCPGTCAAGAAPARPQLGDTCGGSVSSVGGACVNSFCDSNSSTCKPYVAASSACTDTSVCAIGLGCTGGHCQPLPATGSACSPFPGCLDVGDSCNATTSMCTRYAIAGEACSSTTPCYFMYNCDSTQHCVLRPTLGDACMPMSNFDCADNSYCNSSTLVCTPYAQDGNSCTVSVQCASGECDNTTKTCVSSTCI